MSSEKRCDIKNSDQCDTSENCPLEQALLIELTNDSNDNVLQPPCLDMPILTDLDPSPYENSKMVPVKFTEKLEETNSEFIGLTEPTEDSQDTESEAVSEGDISEFLIFRKKPKLEPSDSEQPQNSETSTEGATLEPKKIVKPRLPSKRYGNSSKRSYLKMGRNDDVNSSNNESRRVTRSSDRKKSETSYDSSPNCEVDHPKIVIKIVRSSENSGNYRCLYPDLQLKNSFAVKKRSSFTKKKKRSSNRKKKKSFARKQIKLFGLEKCWVVLKKLKAINLAQNQNRQKIEDNLTPPDTSCDSVTKHENKNRDDFLDDDILDLAVKKEDLLENEISIESTENRRLHDSNSVSSLVICKDVRSEDLEEERTEEHMHATDLVSNIPSKISEEIPHPTVIYAMFEETKILREEVKKEPVHRPDEFSDIPSEKSNSISNSPEKEESFESDDDSSVASELSLYAPSLSDILNSPNRNDDLNEKDKPNVQKDPKTYRIPKLPTIADEVKEILSQTIRHLPKMLSPIRDLPLKNKNENLKERCTRWSAPITKTILINSICSTSTQNQAAIPNPPETLTQASTDKVITNTCQSQDSRQLHQNSNGSVAFSHGSVPLSQRFTLIQSDSKQASLPPADPISSLNPRSGPPLQEVSFLTPNRQLIDGHPASKNNPQNIQQTLQFFESPCLKFVSQKPCLNGCRFRHELPSSDVILSRMTSMQNETVQLIYDSFIKQYAVTFEKYFPAMCRLSINRRLTQSLLRLAIDSEHYKRYDFLQPLYRGLLTCDVNQCDALLHILRNCNISGASEFVIKVVRSSPVTFLNVFKTYPQLVNKLLADIAKGANVNELMECVNLLGHFGEQIVHINANDLNSFLNVALRESGEIEKFKIIQIVKKMSAEN